MSQEQVELICLVIFTVGCCVMFAIGWLCNEMGGK